MIMSDLLIVTVRAIYGYQMINNYKLKGTCYNHSSRQKKSEPNRINQNLKKKKSNTHANAPLYILTTSICNTVSHIHTMTHY